MSKIPTKDRILIAALDLFSERGYDGASVDMIAESIGIKGPSLYRHYKGKDDIRQALLRKMDEYYEINFGSERNPGKTPESMDELVELSLGRINFTISDPSIIKTRKLLMLEQFRDAASADLASRHFTEGISRMFEGIFRGMMAAGVMKEDDPELLAMEFTAPVTLLIHVADRQPERKEEVMQRIEEHMRHFAKVYGA